MTHITILDCTADKCCKKIRQCDCSVIFLQQQFILYSFKIEKIASFVIATVSKGDFSTDVESLITQQQSSEGQ